MKELSDAEIFIWLKSKNFQTEQGEQEYKMYFDVDMPKIIRAAMNDFKNLDNDTNEARAN